MPIFKFFNRNQTHMIVGLITGKKVFWNCSVDVITSRVEYRSSVFIKTVFEATFSLILQYIVDYTGDIESNR